MKCDNYYPSADDNKILRQITTKEDALQLQSEKFTGGMVSDIASHVSPKKPSYLDIENISHHNPNWEINSSLARARACL